jgi:serine/threonine protein kinase
MRRCLRCRHLFGRSESLCPTDGANLVSGPLQIGDVLDKTYEILQAVGSGAIGDVFRARHLIGGVEVAVKVIDFEIKVGTNATAAEDASRRFVREARNHMQLHHPNIVGVRDARELQEEGYAYLAMDFVDGEALTQTIAASTPAVHEPWLSFERVGHLISNIAAGLGAAHERGIVHRDLSTNNVLIVSARSSSERAIVVDFGLAKSADGTIQAISELGTAVGTHHYMSPEQLCGEDASEKADVYSLALCAFEMLTGTMPFAADNVMSLTGKRLERRFMTLKDARQGVNWPTTLHAVFFDAFDPKPSTRPSLDVFTRSLHEALGLLQLTDMTFGHRRRRRKHQIRLLASGLGLMLLASAAFMWTGEGETIDSADSSLYTKVLPSTAVQQATTVTPGQVRQAATKQKGAAAVKDSGTRQLRSPRGDAVRRQQDSKGAEVALAPPYTIPVEFIQAINTALTFAEFHVERADHCETLRPYVDSVSRMIHRLNALPVSPAIEALRTRHLAVERRLKLTC